MNVLYDLLRNLKRSSFNLINEQRELTKPDSRMRHDT